MPNHVENDLRIDGSAEDVAAVLEFIGMNETPPQFDFRRLIPYPEPYASMDKDAESFGPEHWPAHDDPERPAKIAALRALEAAYEAKWGTRSDGYNSGGYEWCRKMWGTKWGAYHAARRDYDGDVIITFQTAWSPPGDEVMATLARQFPLCSFHLEYFERGSGFCGGASWPSEEDWYEDDEWWAGKKAESQTWYSNTYGGTRGG